MAGFKTHITTSTVLGIGYGAAGYAMGIPLSSCMVGAGLCSVAGMLPDLDSDSGVPLRETITFVAATIPMLMIDRFQHMGFNPEQMVLAGGLIYLFVRFVIAGVFKRYTVHRGMWHSIPAALSVGLLAFLICSCPDLKVRFFKTGAAVLGFMSHLVLDELYSFEWKRGRWRVKKSLGTALKFWSRRSLWANISTYGKLLFFLVLALGDPAVHDHLSPDQSQSLPRMTRQLLDRVLDGEAGKGTHDHHWR